MGYWIGLKGKKVAQRLTREYGLKEATSKNISLTNLEALNEKEANKYVIYQAILEILPLCRNLNELKEKLVKRKIETLYKYKGQSNELQGISFKVGNYKYKGSEIDRKFSVNNLEKTIHQQKIKNLLKLTTASYPKLLSKNRRPETAKHIGQNKNIIEQLLKPVPNDQSLPHQWLLEKKHKKKKPKGLHL